jgi:hypothetical protein
MSAPVSACIPKIGTLFFFHMHLMLNREDTLGTVTSNGILFS